MKPTSGLRVGKRRAPKENLRRVGLRSLCSNFQRVCVCLFFFFFSLLSPPIKCFQMFLASFPLRECLFRGGFEQVVG